MREVEWDAIAGVVAAVVALVLHVLHVVDTEVILAVLLMLAALLLIRDLRREGADERTDRVLQAVAADTEHIRSQLATPEVVLVGPRRLLERSKPTVAPIWWMRPCCPSGYP